MTRGHRTRFAAVILALAAALAGCVAAPSPETESPAIPGDDPGLSIPINHVLEYMDYQRKALALALQAERAYGDAELQILDDHALLVRLSSDALFRVASTELRPQGRVTLDDIGRVLERYHKTILYIVVHTDNAGNAVYNQRLSAWRARTVVDYLAGRGVARIRMWPSGHGAHEPIASNRTTEGRRRNRRVDIVIKPIVRGLESSAYLPPLPSERPPADADVEP